MKINLVKQNGITDITDVVSTVNWSGSVSQAARSLELAVINAPEDKNVVKLGLKIAAGDLIQFYDKDLIFLGQVITATETTETGTITYTCNDLLNHLLKSTGVYNFSNTTAEQITKKVCADFAIETGTIITTNVPIKKMIIDGSSIYDIIMMAYTKAAKQTGKKYICKMIGKKLSVLEKGIVVKGYVLQDGVNITNVTLEETIDNMVNLVKIYDDAGKQIGEVKKDEWLQRFGVYQQIYKKEKGINAITAAKNLLSGIESTISLDGIEGNLECIAGNGVKVKDKATGLNGLYWIDSDTHTWQDGIHTMSLDLNFKNIMEEKESESV